MRWLWPIKTGESFFDLWSLTHFAFWYVVGADVKALQAAGKVKGLLYPLLLALAFAFVWELVERYGFEPRGLVVFPERWWNRWISDPLMAVVGVWVGWWVVKHQ